ncbi:MAG: OmpA family protein [Bacteroidetes bacterium]|nr:OmpA family protein [Bacteroidota bacterium]MBU1718891.1 OmpA family protein [Bacteroidota bacterium]
MKCWILLLVSLFFLSHHSFSQNPVGYSPNGLFFAHSEYLNGFNQEKTYLVNGKEKTKSVGFHKYKISVYNIRKNCHVNDFYFLAEEKNGIDTIIFSPDGRLMYARSDKICRIWNVPKGDLLKDFTIVVEKPLNGKKEKEIDFDPFAAAWRDNYFVLSGYGMLQSFNGFDGTAVCNFSRLPPRFEGEKFQVSPDDLYISISGDNKVLIWKNGTSRMLKRLSGNGYEFTPDCKSIVVMRNSGNYLYTYVYELPTFLRKKKISYNNLLREYAKDMDVAEGKRPGTTVFKIDGAKCSLTPDGRSMIVVAIRDGKEHLLVYNTITSELRMSMMDQGGEGSFCPYNLINDSLMFFRKNEIKVLLNIYNGYSTVFEDYSDDGSGKGAFSGLFKRNKKDEFYSPDFRYRLVRKPMFRDLKRFELNTLRVKQEPSYILASEFVGFTPDSRYAIMKMQDGRFGYVESRATDMAMEPGELKVTLLDDGDCPINAEKPIADVEIPAEYEYNRITGFRHISEINDTAVYAKLIMKTMDLGDTMVSIQVHLMDKDGNYYYGAASDDWKQIWCNLLLKDPSGKTRQVADFEVEEFQERDTLPNAISLVLDHSGSMGEDRAVALQGAAKTFINQKKPDDAVSVVKYDQGVGIEARLNKDKSLLLSGLMMQGLLGYGGGTALLDGTNAGLSTLAGVRGFGRQAVILFTDGMENSSYLKKNDIITRAIREKRNIYTIGFGEYISEDYLQSLSYYTSGSYYRIYRTEDFNWIFEDIYSKMRNYYRIRFKTDTTGIHTALLKICIDDIRKDSLVVAFDNTQIDLEKAQKSEKDVFKVPLTHISREEISLQRIEIIPDISDFTKVGVTKGTWTDEWPDSLAPDLTDIEIEFEQIKFPDIKFVFDKTVIVPGTDEGIEDVARFMEKYPFIRIEIGGHTDNFGDDLYNQELSGRRAETVKQVIVDMGIAAGRIETKGYGESAPVLENTTDENRQVNRRVEFRILNE